MNEYTTNRPIYGTAKTVQFIRLEVRKVNLPTLAFAVVILALGPVLAAPGEDARKFDPERDLLSLHYDHAPDKDDGQSAVADLTILASLYGRGWIEKHVVAVSGAYGTNAKRFNSKSDAVMDAAWNDCGGWLAAHANRQQAVTLLAKRFSEVLQRGGDVWVKEGGQSDITAEVVKRLRSRLPDINAAKRIHVVQHSDWNENHTTQAALAYTKRETHYIRIRDANNYLNIKGGNEAFERAAKQHPLFGPAWKAAFAYYNPKERLDFSDTGELMHILGLGELGIEDFRKRFLIAAEKSAPNKPDADDGN
jgi:hypothetical protein